MPRLAATWSKDRPFWSLALQTKTICKFFGEKTVPNSNCDALCVQGTIQIEPFEKGAKGIALVNKSEEEVNIGGWSLTNLSGDDESSYKFHRSTTIPAGGTCTVYSADSTEVN